MQFTHRRHSLVLVFMVALALIGFRAPVAQAAPGNGAYVIEDQECYEDEGYTICFSSKGVFNETVTPSGNISIITNGRSSYRVTDRNGNVVTEGSYKYHFRVLTKDQVLQLLSDRSRFTYTTFFGETCTGSYAFHFANDRIQFERGDFSCSFG